MNELAPDLTQQVLQPGMHQKILLRAAELVLSTALRRPSRGQDSNEG
jgi:hypothetical protein